MILPRGNEILYPEQWADLTSAVVPGIDNIYKISTYGRIYNIKTGNYLPQNIFYRDDHYITVSIRLLNGDHVMCQIHRLLMMTFCPINNPESYDVNHKDGIKYHNWIWNLEWATHRDNSIHASINKLFVKRGDERLNTSVTEKEVHEVCRLISLGYSCSQIANMITLSNDANIRSLYNNIMNGHCWKHISQQYDFSKAYSRRVLSQKQLDLLYKTFETNLTISTKDAAKLLGVDLNIVNEKNFISIVTYHRNKYKKNNGK